MRTARKLVRSLLRDLAASGLASAGLTDLGRRMRGRLMIVTFHRVLTAEQRARYPLPGLAVTPEELDWHVSVLKRHFDVLPPSEAVERLQRSTDGRPLCAITFDDGQLDNYVLGKPVLEAQGVRAAFYLPVIALEESAPLWHDRLGFATLQAFARGGSVLEGARDRLGVVDARADMLDMMDAAKAMAPKARMEAVESIEALTGTTIPDWAGMMSWEQVRELSAAGHEIGSHTMTHPILPRCKTEQIEHEIAESRHVIEARLDAPVHSFCYPNGDSDARAIEAVKRAGYRNAVTTAWGSNGRDSDAFLLHRCDMVAEDVTHRSGRLSEKLLRLRLSGLHPSLH
ncbi:MAG: polysaccharide deacetylase family protein [Myxococcales bacterium]|nr:polysaccharide deacetylase family protein [Myxococcales bacterium]